MKKLKIMVPLCALGGTLLIGCSGNGHEDPKEKKQGPVVPHSQKQEIPPQLKAAHEALDKSFKNNDPINVNTSLSIDAQGNLKGSSIYQSSTSECKLETTYDIASGQVIAVHHPGKYQVLNTFPKEEKGTKEWNAILLANPCTTLKLDATVIRKKIDGKVKLNNIEKNIEKKFEQTTKATSFEKLVVALAQEQMEILSKLGNKPKL